MRPLPEWIDTLFAERAPKKLFFRVDAGRVSGLSFGHLSRCLLLAECCRQAYGTESLFVMRDYPEGVQYAQQQGQTVYTLQPVSSPGAEFQIVLEYLVNAQSDWLVHDLPYKFQDDALFSFCKKNQIYTLFIDDARFITPMATVTLNSSILAPSRVSPNDCKSDRLLLGSDYFLHNLECHKIAQAPAVKPTILLTFGGSDPAGLTIKMIKALSNHSWQNVTFQVMLGPGYRDPEQTMQLADDLGFTCTFLLSPKDQILHYKQASLVICAGGRTMYELMALNVPFYPIASAPHETEAVEAFFNTIPSISVLAAKTCPQSILG